MADKFNLDGFAVSEDNVCTADGGFVGNLTGTLTGSVTGGEGYSADGAIDPTVNSALVAPIDESLELTLADGQNGHQIRIIGQASIWDIVITPAIFSNGSTITFTGGNDKYVDLTWMEGSGWVATSTNAVIA